MNYSEAVARMRMIKDGMTKPQLINLMGEPFEKARDSWFYDFSKLQGFPRRPVSPGLRIFFGVRVFLVNDAVSRVKMSWVDAE